MRTIHFIVIHVQIHVFADVEGLIHFPQYTFVQPYDLLNSPLLGELHQNPLQDPSIPIYLKTVLFHKNIKSILYHSATSRYKENGRPAIPPSFMVGLIMIQKHQNWSDSAVIEAAMFDDRVKYALGLSRSPEISCEQSMLCKFRARALEHDLDRKFLGQTLLNAAETEMLSHDVGLVDSFMVAGAAAKKGTFILIHETVRSVLHQLTVEGLESSKLVRIVAFLGYFAECSFPRL